MFGITFARSHTSKHTCEFSILECCTMLCVDCIDRNEFLKWLVALLRCSRLKVAAVAVRLVGIYRVCAYSEVGFLRTLHCAASQHPSYCMCPWPPVDYCSRRMNTEPLLSRNRLQKLRSRVSSVKRIYSFRLCVCSIRSVFVSFSASLCR